MAELHSPLPNPPRTAGEGTRRVCRANDTASRVMPSPRSLGCGGGLGSLGFIRDGLRARGASLDAHRPALA